jgi:T-lymphoma invasion and metastasis-inducing protein 1
VSLDSVIGFPTLTSSSFSTAEFRNAFLKTIRQIIRESVRNMNLPPLMMQQQQAEDNGRPEVPRRAESTRLSAAAAATGVVGAHHGGGSGRESPAGSSRTLQSSHRKRQTPKQAFSSLQRHSSGGNIDYDNVENCGSASGVGALGLQPQQPQHVRARSRTMGDGCMGERATS